MLELQCVGRKRVKGFGVRSMAKVKIKMDGHCPAYMLTAEPCGQTSPNRLQEPSPVSSCCLPLSSKIRVVQMEETDT
jgi:hypothetical protein